MRQQLRSEINHQVLRAHQLIAEKILVRPELINQAKTKLEQRYEQGLVRYGSYISWLSILEFEDDIPHLQTLLCEQSLQMDKLRLCSPFIGIEAL